MISLVKLSLPGPTIGIAGGGRLGHMVAASVKEMGFEVGTLDSVSDCLTAQIIDWHVESVYDDTSVLEGLAGRINVIIYKFENISVEVLNMILPMSLIPQGTDLLAITQDHLLEKFFLETNNIMIASYAAIVSPVDTQDAIDGTGCPCVLGAVRGGYGGKGQHALRSRTDLVPTMGLLKEGACVLETRILSEREILVMVTGNDQGDLTVSPVVENIHHNNILRETITSTTIDQDMVEGAGRIARMIAEAVNLSGVLGIEMFLTETDELYVNESAPRPHNFGRYSIEACSMSQFDARTRGICGWPLGEKVCLISDTVTVNVLGKQLLESYRSAGNEPDWQFHFYGKRQAEKGRRIGHITILTEDI